MTHVNLDGFFYRGWLCDDCLNILRSHGIRDPFIGDEKFYESHSEDEIEALCAQVNFQPMCVKCFEELADDPAKPDDRMPPPPRPHLEPRDSRHPVSIVIPRDITRRHAELPAICGACGHQTFFSGHSEAIEDALIGATTLHKSYAELALLNRASALFARFPHSRWALKVHKEQLRPKLFARTDHDPELEAALATDPELSYFLRHSIFHLPSRHRGVTQLIASLEESDFSDIHCPACTLGVLRLPDGFPDQ